MISYSQSITVKGSVSDLTGTLPGVNIVIKGENKVTTTDIEGKYSIKTNNGVVLKFSYVSYNDKEIIVNSPTHNVILEESTDLLDEVVVTALGISRKKKSLVYTVQDLKGGNINKASEGNIVNAFSGKIAGVQIQGTGNIGGSSRILLRRASSLTGKKQPLFVIDGVPVDNSNFGSISQAYGSRDDINGNVDYSTQDINPDDIESISVLKGPNAAALYGSRASNGVILITTKRGKESIRANNPFWLAYKDYQDDQKNRSLGNVNLKYAITNKISASLKYGFDKYEDRRYTPYFISKIYTFSEENIEGLLPVVHFDLN